MKKYLLFDLDGTLTDPKEGICTCVQYSLASFGIEEPDLDKLEPFIGPPLKDSFMEFYHMDALQAEAAIEKYRERFQNKGIFENKVYEGIPGMLRKLSAKGMVLAVASSKPTVFVRRILEHFRIDKYFKVVVGSELDGTRTGKDEVVQEALRQLFDGKSVDTDQVYMIGDRRFDVEGAHAAHVESVGVTYGYGSMEELKEAKSDYIVRSVEELGRFLLRDAEEERQESPSQRAWRMLFPFLMFFLVRNVAVNAFSLLLAGAGGAGGDFWVIRDESGTPVEFTGNASAIMWAAGFLAGGAAVLGTAGKMIARAAQAGKLAHIKREPGKSYVLLGGACAGLVLGVNILLELLGVTGASDVYRSVSERQFSAWLWVGLVCYGIIAPAAEELLFRGIIYNGLREFMKPAAAAVVSAIFFAGYHGNLVQGVYSFILGCFIAYAYEYFGSFKVPVGIHMAANLIVYALGQNGDVLAVIVNWPVCIVCLALAAGSIWGLCREKRTF